MLQGFATHNIYAADTDAARDWYAEVLGIEAYYQMPGYVEFRVGVDEDELGIIDARYAPPGATAGPAGGIINWHVDDVAQTLARLLELGATPYAPVTPHGAAGDFITAAVVDPFGNILGFMQNPHWAARHN